MLHGSFGVKIIMLSCGLQGTSTLQNGGDAAVEGEPTQNHVLLFARCLRESFVYCGRLCNPVVDWEAGGSGVFVWELQVRLCFICTYALRLTRLVGCDPEGDACRTMSD